MASESRHDRGIIRRFLTEALASRVEKAKRERQRRTRDKSPDERPHAALVFDAGPVKGLGAAIAARAAAGGMKAYLAGPNTQVLDTGAGGHRDAGQDTVAIAVDLSQPEHIHGAFETVRGDGCRLELVVHNAGSKQAMPLLDLAPEELEERWAADCRSGFLIGQEAISTMLGQPGAERGLGTVLFSGAPDAMRATAGFAAFAQAKAGLRMLSQALAREFGPEGIHVAHIIIDGAQGEGCAPDPAAIAETYWNIYQQHRSAWTQEIDLLPTNPSW